MRYQVLFSAAALVLSTLTVRANADTVPFSFAGPGVSGSVVLTYGTATDAKYPTAFEVTGASGTFTDAKAGILNAPILGLMPITHATPDPTNLLAPADFSRFNVATGTYYGSLSYDNLFWPGGSPKTASDYPFSGGFVDIYGLLLNIGDGRVVDFWSNGMLPGTNFDDYGVTVATSAMALDSVGTGVTPTPEPGTLWLLGTGVVGMVLQRRPSLLRRRS